MRRYTLIFILGLVFIIGVAVFYFKNNLQKISVGNKIAPVIPLITSLPAMFEHPLSIEKLRSRTYQATPLVRESIVAQNAAYTKYLISYQSDRLKIYGVMAVPRSADGGQKLPAILFNHGYIPPDQYINTEKYVAYIDTFARAGYVVLMPDYRGHGESQGNPEGGYFSPGYTIDVLNAYESLKKDSTVDPKRIGMWGHSMGGHVSVRAAAINPDIKSIVIWAGVVGRYEDIFNLFFRRPSREGTQQQQARWRTTRSQIVGRYGEPDENSEFWTSIDAVKYLAKDQEFQIHHGAVDSTVNVEVSRVFQKYLQSKKFTSEYFEYPYEDHNINGPSFVVAMQRAIDFFDQNL